MTREELKRHCLKQIESCEKWARYSGQEPYGKIYEEHKLILELLEQEPKTGHWEWVQYDYNPKLGNWHCSECRSVVIECVDKNDKGGIPLYKYCPQCGAKMIEPQESEDKE